MITTARVLSGLLSVFFLFAACKFMFFPHTVLEKLALEPNGVFGLANIRAGIGAPLMAFGVCCAIATINL